MLKSANKHTAIVWCMPKSTARFQDVEQMILCNIKWKIKEKDNERLSFGTQRFLFIHSHLSLQFVCVVPRQAVQNVAEYQTKIALFVTKNVTINLFGVNTWNIICISFPFSVSSCTLYLCTHRNWIAFIIVAFLAFLLVAQWRSLSSAEKTP